jgi:hypothetical protein
MKLEVAYARWPFIRSDQWFLPRFRVKLANLGREIPRGSIQVDIADAERLSTLAEITSFTGPFQDVFHREVNALQAGGTEDFVFKIQSRFLKPGRYILRAHFSEWIPSDSPVNDLREQLRRAHIPDDKVREIEAQSIQTLQDQGINPYQRPTGQFRAKSLFDFRLTEVIKIHPLSGVATILGGFIGSVLAVCVSFLYASIRLISENWETIRGVLRVR